LRVKWWVDENLRREVGDDVSMLFWWDPWLTRGVLKDRFIRLFDLSSNKMATMADMKLLGWGEGVEA